MKRNLITMMLFLMVISASAQKQKYLGMALFNTQTAVPFGKFAGLFTKEFHPGLEATYGKNISSRKKHDWFLEVKLAYFFHRYVQHGILLYLNFGYRYKINSRFSAETSIGAGYMQSIPATAKLKLNGNGDYVNNKGVGRMQAIATFEIGLGYTPNPSVKRPVTIFTNYQQRIQMPFVKSYVPLLPYNSLMLGIRIPIK